MMDRKTLTTARRQKLRPTDLGLRPTFEVRSETLPNGLKVLMVENSTVPAVSLNASVMAGARYDPEEKAGLALMVSRLLDEGTENRTSLEIAEAIESVGGSIDADGSFERIVVSAGVLNKDVDLGLELLADLLMRPAFPPEYVIKEKSARFPKSEVRRIDHKSLPAGHSMSWFIRSIHYIAHRTVTRKQLKELTATIYAHSTSSTSSPTM